MKLKIKEEIQRAARSEADYDGESRLYLSLRDSIELSARLNISRRELELAALEAGVVPERYRRNIPAVGLAGQIRLLRSKVGVAGAGGLGGLAIELLARMGVGGISVIDDDRFCESNLNRQLLAVEEGLARDKAGAAAARVAAVNGAVEVRVLPGRGDAASFPDFLRGCDLALDCLDNLSSRFVLERACQEAGIPLVHGAVAGFLGQCAVIRPGRPLFALIYGGAARAEGDRGAEQFLGTPAATPALVAAWQVNEAVKILAGLAEPAGDRLAVFDLLSGETTFIKLGG